MVLEHLVRTAEATNHKLQLIGETHHQHPLKRCHLASCMRDMRRARLPLPQMRPSSGEPGCRAGQISDVLIHPFAVHAFNARRRVSAVSCRAWQASSPPASGAYKCQGASMGDRRTAAWDATTRRAERASVPEDVARGLSAAVDAVRRFRNASWGSLRACHPGSLCCWLGALSAPEVCCMLLRRHCLCSSPQPSPSVRRPIAPVLAVSVPLCPRHPVCSSVSRPALHSLRFFRAAPDSARHFGFLQ